ncbi:hypothetical protein [Acinetobacter wuhouensis]|uniref:Uncharacterized protein n=1 Tax=Acinetobacter wuhouensis TaxID=1879050 RepID=A0A3G2T1R8_9GAMM|nr:hypothetical protein [Acinetobacter wuhouensis]AYO54169.1 hypothetical protein CDG68_11205 [Acinetobacter wuhouensis]
MTPIDFRAELYKTYVASGMTDHVLIQEYINIAEAFVFNKSQLTMSEFNELMERLAKNQN